MSSTKIVNNIIVFTRPCYIVVQISVTGAAKSHESGLLAQELPSTFFVVQVAGGLVADFTLVVFFFKVFCFGFFIFSILYSPSG